MGQHFGAVSLVVLEEFQKFFCIVDGVLISLRAGSDESGICELRYMIEGNVEGKGSRQAEGHGSGFLHVTLQAGEDACIRLVGGG